MISTEQIDRLPSAQCLIKLSRQILNLLITSSPENKSLKTHQHKYASRVHAYACECVHVWMRACVFKYTCGEYACHATPLESIRGPNIASTYVHTSTKRILTSEIDDSNNLLTCDICRILKYYQTCKTFVDCFIIFLIICAKLEHKV